MLNMPSARIGKVLAGIITPVALLAAGTMVYSASYAAFTDQTSNEGNQWSTGSISLSEDDNGTSRFQVPNMLPGGTR